MTAPGFKVSDAAAGVRARGLVLALALSAWLPMVACTTDSVRSSGLNCSVSARSRGAAMSNVTSTMTRLPSRSGVKCRVWIATAGRRSR